MRVCGRTYSARIFTGACLLLLVGLLTKRSLLLTQQHPFHVKPVHVDRESCERALGLKTQLLDDRAFVALSGLLGAVRATDLTVMSEPSSFCADSRLVRELVWLPSHASSAGVVAFVGRWLEEKLLSEANDADLDSMNETSSTTIMAAPSRRKTATRTIPRVIVTGSSDDGGAFLIGQELLRHVTSDGLKAVAIVSGVETVRDNADTFLALLESFVRRTHPSECVRVLVAEALHRRPRFRAVFRSRLTAFALARKRGDIEIVQQEDASSQGKDGHQHGASAESWEQRFDFRFLDIKNTNADAGDSGAAASLSATASTESYNVGDAARALVAAHHGIAEIPCLALAAEIEELVRGTTDSTGCSGRNGGRNTNSKEKCDNVTSNGDSAHSSMRLSAGWRWGDAFGGSLSAHPPSMERVADVARSSVDLCGGAEIATLLKEAPHVMDPVLAACAAPLWQES